MKDKLIILTGPTAVGKTELSIELAKRINGEIISADCVQVYKELDIGSAKITKEEMRGVKHHLIDVLPPDEDFNVYIFKEMATKAIKEILAQGKIPIIVGGTGFYIQSVIYDIDFKEEDNSKVRAKYEKMYEEYGADFLHDKLQEIDPESAKTIHKNNVKRVIRALEYYEINGKKISEHNEEERMKEPKYDVKYFVLNDDREKLYNRINKRVDLMFDNGLLEEVEMLKNKGLDKTFNSMQGIGYKEVLDYLDGNLTFEEAKELLKKNTRNYAKRQLTWFRREKNVIWFDKLKYDYNDERILSQMIEIIENE